MSNIPQRETRVVAICGGDYMDRLRYLEQRAKALKDAEDGTPRTLDEVPEYMKLFEEHEALRQEAAENTTYFRLQALERKDWKDLVAKHPPRKGNASDEELGFNDLTIREDLVPASVIEPEDAGEYLAALSDGNFDQLYINAYMLNVGLSQDPKAGLSLALQMRSKRDATSD